MKKLFAGITLLLAAAMLLCSCSMVKINEERDGESIVATIGDDVKITKAEFKDYYYRMMATYGLDPEDDSEDMQAYLDLYAQTALTSLVNSKVLMLKAKEMGVDTLSDEELADVQQQYDDVIEQETELISSALTTENETNGVTMTDSEFEKEVEKRLEEDLAQLYYTKDSLYQEFYDYAIYDHVYDEIYANLEVTEDMIQEEYDSRVEEAKTSYEEDVTAWEEDYGNGETIYYIPSGVRYIKHILIKFGDDKTKEVATLRAAGSTEEADELRTDYLKDIKEKAEEVLALVKEDGSNFDELMAEYSEDTASASAAYAYGVVNGGSTYDSNFYAGANALKAGEISGLVESDYGYHIMYCTGAPAMGAVPLADVRNAITEDFMDDLESEELSNKLTEWKETMNIKTYTDRLR